MKEYTIENAREKLEAELKFYRDGDSKYVVEKLIERCEVDKELLNAIMLPHKSYDKAFQYFYQKSRTVGYKMPHGNMVYLDNEMAVQLSIEYFKQDDAAEEKKKVVVKKDQPTKSLPGKEKKEYMPKKSEMDGQISLFEL